MDRIGRYRIVRELGRGAMGVVYHAVDPDIGRPVAIKTIRLGDVGSTQERARLRERLSREARSAGILSHPGIVTIYDVSQEGEVAYIAMEFVDGSTLDETLSAPHPISQRRVFSILGQTAMALDYAHQKGIVHRDIKPANIMIAGDGNVKITDFGIAKINASEQFTMTGTIVGTPHYMAPEQVQGQAVDGRADQFSLAVVAFEMFTGEKPFTGEQLTTVVYKIVAEDPPPVHRINATLTGQIEQVLKKGLAKKAEARYRNCQEFVDALEDACSAARNWRAMPRGVAHSEPTVAGKPLAKPPVLPPPRKRRDDSTTIETRRRSGALPLLFGFLMAAALVGMVAWQASPWLSNSGGAQPESTASPASEPSGMDAKKPSAMSALETAPSTAPEEQPPAAEPPAADSAPVENATAEPPPAPPQQVPPAPEPVKAAAPEPVQPAAVAARVPAGPPPGATFQVLVPTHPPGATAALEGRPETECRTPCNIHAGLGHHRIIVTMPGHQTEYRTVEVTGAPLELPLVSMRIAGGTLMLATAPQGAAISIDGRRISQTTPAQLALAPGTYSITVEKGGRRASERIDVRRGATTYLKIPLDQ